MERKVKSQQTVGVEHINAFLRDNQITPAMLSSHLGLSHGCVKKWQDNGKAPKWTLAAIEGLRRRIRANNDQPKVMVLSVTRDKLARVQSFLNATGVEFKEI